MNDTKKDKESLNISLIIDENHITHIDVDAKKIEDVGLIIGKVCKKYNLDNKIKEKLGKEINKRIDDIMMKKQNEKMKKTQNTINRLYYESVEKNKEKQAFLEKIRTEKENEILDSLPFTPSINKNSNLLYEKRHLKIEDKLYNEFIAIKEKQTYTKLITELSQRSKSNGKTLNKNINDCKCNTIEHFHKTNSIWKNSSKNLNLKECKKEGSLIIYNKLVNNSNYKGKKNKIYKKHKKSSQEGDKETNDEVSQINKIRNYNTDENLDDSYLNLMALQNKYRSEDKSIITSKDPLDNKENESKATAANLGFRNHSFKNISNLNANKSPRLNGNKPLENNSYLNLYSSDLLAKTPAFLKNNIDTILESTGNLGKKRNTFVTNNSDFLLSQLAKKFSFHMNNNNFEKNSYTKRYRTLTKSGLNPNQNQNFNLNLNNRNNSNNQNSDKRHSLNQNLLTNNIKNYYLTQQLSCNRNNQSVNQFNLNLNNSANHLTYDPNSNQTQAGSLYGNTMQNVALKDALRANSNNISPETFFLKEYCSNSKGFVPNINNHNNDNNTKTNNLQSNIFNIDLNHKSKEKDFKENSNFLHLIDNYKYSADDVSSNENINTNNNNKNLTSGLINNNNNAKNNHFNQNTEVVLGSSNIYNNIFNPISSLKEKDFLLVNKNLFNEMSPIISYTENLNKQTSAGSNINNNINQLKINSVLNSNLNISKNFNNVLDANFKESFLHKNNLTSKEIPKININGNNTFENKISNDLFGNAKENSFHPTTSNFASPAKNRNNKLEPNENKKANKTDKYLIHIKNDHSELFKNISSNSNICNENDSKKFNSETIKNETYLTISNYNNISNINLSNLNNVKNNNHIINNNEKNNEKQRNNHMIKDINEKKKNNKSKNKNNIKSIGITNNPLTRSLDIKKAKQKYNIKKERGSKDIFTHLYDTRNDTKNFREIFSKEILSQICTFKPEISIKSASLDKNNNKFKTKDDLFKRLAESKRLKNIFNTISSKRDFRFSTIQTSKETDKKNSNFNESKSKENVFVIKEEKQLSNIDKEIPSAYFAGNDTQEKNISSIDSQQRKNLDSLERRYEENKNLLYGLLNRQMKKKYQTLDSYATISSRGKETESDEINNNNYSKKALNNINLNCKSDNSDVKNLKPIWHSNLSENVNIENDPSDKGVYENPNKSVQMQQSKNIRLENDKFDYSKSTNDKIQNNESILNSFQNQFRDYNITNSIDNQLNTNSKINNNTTTNSKRIVFSCKRNHTENSLNVDVLNSNEFKISNSILPLRHHSKKNINLEENFNHQITDKIGIRNSEKIFNNDSDNLFDMNTINLSNENSQSNNYFPLKLSQERKIFQSVKNKKLLNKNSPIDDNKQAENERGHYLNPNYENENDIENMNDLNNISNANSNVNLEKHNLQTEENSHNTFIVHTTNSDQVKLKCDFFHKNKSSKNLLNLTSNFIKSKTNKIPSSINKSRESKKIRELKEEENLYGQIEELKKEKIRQGEQFKKRFAINIDKVKTNSIKEIYEIVERNIANKNSLRNLGFSPFIIERLVFPVISIIQKRNLEFNFNNFKALAQEFINRVF